MTEDALLDRLNAETTPAWTLRVTLGAMRDRGWEFDTAWYSATQRLRVQPSMSPDDAEELLAFKAWFEWSRPLWEWAYNAGHSDDRPTLVDGEVFAEGASAVVAELPRPIARGPSPDGVSAAPRASQRRRRQPKRRQTP